MTRLLGLLAIHSLRGLVVASALAAASASVAQADSVAKIVQDYDSFTRQANVLAAGQLGDPQALKRWPDDSRAAVRDRQAQLERFRDRLRMFDTVPLVGEDALNRDILKERFERALQAGSFDEERIPFTSGEGFYTLPESIAYQTNLRTEADAQAWLARIAAIPAYFATETANMRRGVATHFVQPRAPVEEAIRSIRASQAQPPALSPLLRPFDTLPASSLSTARPR